MEKDNVTIVSVTSEKIADPAKMADFVDLSAPVAPAVAHGEFSHTTEPLPVTTPSEVMGTPATAPEAPSTSGDPSTSTQKPKASKATTRSWDDVPKFESNKDKAKKMGDNSIGIDNVVIAKLTMPPADAPQTICYYLLSVLNGHAENIQYQNYHMNIRGELSLPGVIGQIPLYLGYTRYVRFTTAANTPIAFPIRFEHAIKIGRLSMTDAVVYMRGLTQANKNIADSLTGEAHMSRYVADQLATQFQHGMDIFDCSSIWTIGYIIETMLHNLETQQIAPIFGAF